MNLYRVQAVADLTGRGVMDIVVEGRDALGTWSTVYGWRRGQSHRFTLFSECGTWER